MLLPYSTLVQLASSIGVTFHPLEDVKDKHGHQAWTSLDGGKSRELLEALALEESLRSIIEARNPERVEAQSEEEKRQRESFFKLYLPACLSLNFIQKFLKSTKDRREEEVKEFERQSKVLYSNMIDLDKRNASKWYLHLLLMHIPAQLRQEKNIAKYSCCPQERINSQHYHQAQTSVSLDATGSQLLKRKRFQVFYDCNHPELKKEKRNYPKGRKSVEASPKRARSAPLQTSEKERMIFKKRVLQPLC